MTRPAIHEDSTPPGTVVIVGGGQAGAQAVDSLRRAGFGGRLVLIGAEATLPYQRPPLSKKYLQGELAAERLPFRHRAFYDEHDVELELGRRAVQLDVAASVVELDDGRRLDYHRLLLCLGATPRRPSWPGANLAGVHVLRTVEDADAIRADVRSGSRVVIVGGGYVGLETAATLRAMGCEVTVVEAAERILNRVASPESAAHFGARHREHGVRIRCGTGVARFEGATRVARVVLGDGTTLESDVVVVGIGAAPVTELAARAGLPCDDGVLVDAHCRTADARVFAAGDCARQESTRYGRRLRLESVDNAFEQAKTAAAAMLGAAAPHDRVPWFWSDQYQDKLLIVGLAEGHDRRVLRGDPQSGSFSVSYLKDGELIAVEAVNHSKDYMAGRKLIAERARVDPAALADPRVEMKDARIAPGTSH